MPTLIYIHGRGKKGPPPEEQQKWYTALQEGFTRLHPEQAPSIASDQLQLAYWSDIFYPQDPTPANPQGLPAPEQAVVNLMLPKMRASMSGQRAAMAGDQRRLLGAFTMAPADPPAQQASDSFLADIIKYFGLGYAAKVRVPFVRLLTDLPLKDGLTVVSHSFGTLIAYDVLLTSLDSINADRKAHGKDPVLVDTLITMGSPLGWAYDSEKLVPVWVQQVIVEADQAAGQLAGDVKQVLQSVETTVSGFFQRFQRGISAAAAAPRPSVDLFELPAKQFPPNGVNRWLNIFDPRDPVSSELGIGALTVADTFLYGTPPEARERAFDVPIKNEFAPANSRALTIDAHNDVGYGRCAQLAQAVHDFWFRWQRPSSPAS